jgi:putative CocE/NonD family hydrolase
VAAPDATPLHTVVRPAGDGRAPASLFRTPYGVDFEMVDPNAGLERPQVATVLQDVRGRGRSGGRFDVGASDPGDGAATIAWVARQPWCDGRVAMHGISYAGYTQLQAARARPPELVSIAPTRCPAWWRRLTMHEGGALCLSLAAHWLPRQAAEAPDTPDWARAALYELALEFEQVVVADGAPRLDMGLVRRHPGLTRRPLLVRSEYAAAPRYGQIWRELFSRPFAHTWLSDPGPAPGDAITVPTLVLGAWYDLWAQDQVAMFRALQRTSPPEVARAHRLVMTPFSHAPEPAGEVAYGPEARRFDDTLAAEWNREWLLGRPGLAHELAPVTYYVGGAGAGRWDEADTWPPSGASVLTMYLSAGGERHTGGLAAQPPTVPEVKRWVHDPRDPVPTRGGPALGLPAGPVDHRDRSGGARPDVCSFTGPPLDEPLELAGPVTAEVHLASDADDADVCVVLLDVSPDGRALCVADGYTRGRWRNGPGTAPLRRDEVSVFPVHCWNAAYRVEAGHRLRVDVCSSNFPPYDVNPGTGAPPGTDRDDDLRCARQSLHTGSAHPSAVHLTVRPAVHGPR